MELALAEIESLEPGEQFSYAQNAKKFGVSRSTLSRRHRGVQGSKKQQYENMQFLNPQQTKELINYINKQAKKGLFSSNEMVKNFAEEIAGKKAGKNWVSRWLKKHDDKLQKMEEYDIQPEDTYNMDEKGFLIRILSKCKRIFSKESYIAEGSKQRLQDGNHE
ncbi:hypothetical protein AN2382.2 [Aspergillus nidulans FGSC A4]|nr:hypothetical protein AN2382.2 [Aspergillus nidulans FGSC A4]|eukprot:XP_659986.1 hypothetical protein AN2382.2 [Aspergillus nidulans FGSC A4]